MTILRSLLFVPGNKANMLAKALALQPDAFMPDMEDSVPAAEKANARATIAWLPAAARGDRHPRNSARERARHGVDRGRSRRRRRAAHLRRLDRQGARRRRHQRDLAAPRRARAARRLERRNACSSCHGSRPPRPSSSAARFAARASGSSASPSAARISQTTWESSAWKMSRRCVRTPGVCIAARAAHVLALDTPYFKLRDPDGLRDNSLRAKSLGFKGKFAIHPEQVGDAQRVLLAVGAGGRSCRARRRRVRGSRARGRASTSLDGWVIDVPVVKRARALLELARRARVER